MKNVKGLKRALAAVLCAALLSGCADKTSSIPVLPNGNDSADNSSENNVSSSSAGNAYVFPDVSQMIRPSSKSSSVSKPTVSEYEPQEQEQSSENDKPAPIMSVRPPQSESSISQDDPTVWDIPTDHEWQTEQSSDNVTTKVYVEQAPEPVQTDSASLENFAAKWAYGNISIKQRQIYARLFACAEKREKECDVSDLGASKDDLYTAFWAFDYDNPQFLELGSGYTYKYSKSDSGNKMKSMEINYGRTSSEVPQTQFDNAAAEILAKARAMGSGYEKLKYIHDRLIGGTVYTNTDADYESEADGPVVYGKALCEGYSKAFMYFAQSLGYPCVCAVGSAKGTEHMWNKVKLDGVWYNVDLTWDDPVRSDGTQITEYGYFLISDADLLQTHTIDTPFALPPAPQSYPQY